VGGLERDQVGERFGILGRNPHVGGWLSQWCVVPTWECIRGYAFATMMCDGHGVRRTWRATDMARDGHGVRRTWRATDMAHDARATEDRVTLPKR
jgi:hypothetical protein